MPLRSFIEIWGDVVSIDGNTITVKKTRHFERRWMHKFESDVKELKQDFTVKYV